MIRGLPGDLPPLFHFRNSLYKPASSRGFQGLQTPIATQAVERHTYIPLTWQCNSTESDIYIGSTRDFSQPERRLGTLNTKAIKWPPSTHQSNKSILSSWIRNEAQAGMLATRIEIVQCNACIGAPYLGSLLMDISKDSACRPWRTEAYIIRPRCALEDMTIPYCADAIKL